MDKKYWVPAIEKADAILEAIAAAPGKHKLIDLSRTLSIHKSSMFSLLHTLEELGWIEREPGDTYRLGMKLGRLGTSQVRQYGLVDRFQMEGAKTMRAVGASVQLGRLEGKNVFYLGKVEAPGPVRLASEPGMRFPSHETALGKAMLSQLTRGQFEAIYPERELPTTTPYSLASRETLWQQLAEAEAAGVAYDLQESVMGFCCVAAPVWNEDGLAEEAVSVSMPVHLWEMRQEEAKQEIVKLAAALSKSAPKGGVGP